uniref:Innexin n=1 Tax=Steinernema glaseri TaxID=37863 RepID=A0A1I7YUI5_9BILA
MPSETPAMCVAQRGPARYTFKAYNEQRCFSGLFPNRPESWPSFLRIVSLNITTAPTDGRGAINPDDVSVICAMLKHEAMWGISTLSMYNVDLIHVSFELSETFFGHLLRAKFLKMSKVVNICEDFGLLMEHLIVHSHRLQSRRTVSRVSNSDCFFGVNEPRKGQPMSMGTSDSCKYMRRSSFLDDCIGAALRGPQLEEAESKENKKASPKKVVSSESAEEEMRTEGTQKRSSKKKQPDSEEDEPAPAKRKAPAKKGNKAQPTEEEK